jgi:signal transduction histidine kinase
MNLQNNTLGRRLREAGAVYATMEQIRLIAHDLAPTALEDLDLNLTWKAFCRDFTERTHLPIAIMVRNFSPTSTADICLYRFLQEADECD